MTPGVGREMGPLRRRQAGRRGIRAPRPICTSRHSRNFQSNPLMLSEPGGSMWGSRPGCPRPDRGSRGQLPHRNESSRISEFVKRGPDGMWFSGGEAPSEPSLQGSDGASPSQDSHKVRPANAAEPRSKARTPDLTRSCQGRETRRGVRSRRQGRRAGAAHPVPGIRLLCAMRIPRPCGKSSSRRGLARRSDQTEEDPAAKTRLEVLGVGELSIDLGERNGAEGGKSPTRSWPI